MDGFVTALISTGNITETTLWGTLSSVVPILTIAIIFSLGVYFVRKAIKGISKGKARI